MELEFDKEIDAILRKARGRTSATAVAGDHIDADAIAAFAENALPERTRLLYTGHFADCGRCRKLLSQAIMVTNTADATAADSISTPVIGAPWYSRLFRMPSIAVAMGALVLTFGGVLGYLVLQDRQADGNATIAQSSESVTARSQPQPASNAIASNANAASNTQVASDPSTSVLEEQALQDTRKATGPSLSAEEREADRFVARQEKEMPPTATDTAGAAAMAPAAAAPPKPAEKKAETATITLDGVDAKDAKPDDKNKLLAGARSADESRMRRDAPAPASKVVPSRGPVQMQSNQVNNQIGEMPVTRIVGGKTFNNRDRAWYDSAYKGQATINVRRGSDEFKKLDSGLRSIANNLGGVVVVVWKDKAYRIQ